jgi:hypothetical protein
VSLFRRFSRPAVDNDKSFLDYSSKDQKKILIEAVNGANKRQSDLVEEYNRLQRLKGLKSS